MKNLIVLVVAITLLSSCGKDGAPGAQGPQGPAGNANVFSVVYDVSTWVYDGNVPEYFKDLPVPEINNGVLSGGTVQVFKGNASSGSTIWYAMPYSFEGSEYSYSISYGNIEIERTLSSGGVPSPPPAAQFKVVVIPPY